jgi:hypothetical protein
MKAARVSVDEGQLCPRLQIGGRGAPSQKPSQLQVGKRLVAVYGSKRPGKR